MLNTLKTTWGYLLTLLDKHTAFKISGDTLDDIYNYLPISDTLSSSGQPTARQFRAIRDAGFTTVVNLLPLGIENALDGEADLVKSLGMNYIHIPVVFFRPTDDNFITFAEQMNRLADEKTWVHCAANGRASAFIYRYRTTVLGEDPEMVKWDVREIWEPFGVWKTFMS
ncbi:MAG: protein tyrosine phosphatase family protein, partial [Desulfobacterales bacterium]|nr:protein tyrosine phosphatase family protein [Desulfobacterales bacterium]